MQSNSQHRATENYRHRLREGGIARFEVMGLDSDRKLIRSLAKRLVRNDSEAAKIRESINRSIDAEQGRKGGIAAALLRSPLVGSNLDLERVRSPDRPTDL